MNCTQCAGKAMISQPMGGLVDAEIVETRDRAICALREKGYLLENTLFTDEWYREETLRTPGFIIQRPLFFLAKSLEAMSRCNAVYFCKGWEQARGCRIEHEAAKAYGLEIIYEEDPRQESTGMNFGLALEAAKKGKRIARAGWNGKNQYVELACCISYKNNAAEIINVNHCNIGNKALAFVGTSGVQMGWLASQADMLADDWLILK